MNKILILVLASNTYPSHRNEKAIKKTWAAKNIENINIIFYKSGKHISFKNNELTVVAGKKTTDIGYKTLRAFEWASKNIEFDYLLRTNTSSYVNISELKKKIKTLNNDKNYIYSGITMSLPKNEFRNKIDFISGAGILFNKNTIDLILSNEIEFDRNEMDDVALGKLLQNHKVVPTSGTRFDIKGNITKQELSENYYHYRCRIDNHYGYPRFLEKFVIIFLHNSFYNKNTKRKRFLLNLFFELSKFFYIQAPFWKIYTFTKKILKKILPKNFYKNIKTLLKKLDHRIKLRYLKN